MQRRETEIELRRSAAVTPLSYARQALKLMKIRPLEGGVARYFRRSPNYLAVGFKPRAFVPLRLCVEF